MHEIIYLVHFVLLYIITVHKWTNAEVIYWLTNSVHLPQYADIFSTAGINGSVIPRLVIDIKIIQWNPDFSNPHFF